MTKPIFLDTYALLKLAESPNYLNGASNAVTFATNLIELQYILLKSYGEEAADHFTKLYAKIVKPMDLSTITEAMKWRSKNKKFSYADALGYYYALSNNMKFITGNKAFQGMKNVVIER